MNKSGRFTGIFFILPSFIGVLIFVLLPFLDVVRRSFTSVVAGEWVGLKNYQVIFGNGAFQLAAVNTLKFLLICMPILIGLSLSVSVCLDKQAKFGHMLKSVYLVPMAVPVASIVIIWRVLFHKQGIISGLIGIFGLDAVDWMNSKYAFWVLVLSYVWKNAGYNIVLWMAGLAAIPDSIYEAAKMDGAGGWQIFCKITLPNLGKVAYTITILSLLNSFKVFREAYLVAGDYPHDSMYLLQHLFNNWYRELSLDKLSAAAVIVAIVITLIVLQLGRLFYEEEPRNKRQRRRFRSS